MTELIDPRIIETSYNHQLIELPTEGFSLRLRLEWIKALLTGGDIIYKPRNIQHIDLRNPRIEDNNDSQKMP